MAVPRTPRPPIIAPKPVEYAPDSSEIERWVGRLARAIRLKRLEQGFLGGSVRHGGAATSDDGAAGRS